MKRLFKRLMNAESLRITFTYALFGGVWTLVTNELASLYFDEFEKYKLFQVFKGWIYIIITTILVFLLIHRRIRIYRDEIQGTEEAYKKLAETNEELIKTQEALSFHEEFTGSILRDAPVIIIPWDEERRILSLNPFGEKLLGYKEEEVINSKGWEFILPEEHKFLANSIFNKITSEDAFMNFEIPVVTKDGKKIDVLWSSQKINHEDKKTGNLYIAIGTDMQERKVYEEKIRNMAYYDSLTGLPNKALFDITVDRHREKEEFIIAYMDIDNFKDINDSVGHHAGDVLLKHLADCLRAEIVEPDVVARTGGDEFAVLFLNKSLEDVYEGLENIISRIGATWTYDKRLFYLTFTFGIVRYPEHGESSNILYKNADIAVYAGKRQGKNRIVLYNEKFAEDNLHIIKRTTDLQYAIENDQFILFYQPQYELSTGAIIGIEALARWNHPEEGLLLPSDFIPLAERTGHIYKLDRLIFKMALDQKKVLEDKGYTELSLSINLSTKTLTSEIDFKKLESLIDQYAIDFSKIIIEVTESAGIDDEDLVSRNLRQLKSYGVRIALDDFGTGYSSLNKLKAFPIDVIKLDKTFIKAIPGDGIDNYLIKNIVDLARDLKYNVIAEGIETKEQLEYLKEKVEGWGQGFLLSKPLSSSVLEVLLEESFT